MLQYLKEEAQIEYWPVSSIQLKLLKMCDSRGGNVLLTRGELLAERDIEMTELRQRPYHNSEKHDQGCKEKHVNNERTEDVHF